MISSRADLVAAIADTPPDGVVVCDSGDSPILIDAPVVIDKPLRLVGGRFTVPTGAGFELTSSGVELVGMHISGGRCESNVYDPQQKLVNAKGTQSNPLSGIRVSGCRFEHSRGDNVWLSWCEDSQVSQNLIASFLYSGIMVLSGNRVSVNGNHVRDAPLTDGVVNTYGIAITDMLNTVAGRSRQCSVVGNVVSNIEWEGIDTHGGDRISITGNQVSGCPRGIALVTGNSSRLIPPENCVVMGNVVDGVGATRPVSAGIFLVGISGHPASGTISGNQIVGYEDRPPFSTSYWARNDTYIGGNNVSHVPWTPIELGTDFTANSVYQPEYTVDGNIGHIRGGIIPKSGGLNERTAIGRLPNPAAWPSILTFLGPCRGSNKASGNGQVSISTTGELQMWYGTGTDAYSYWLTGSWSPM